jgi:LysM repeat protein
VVRQGDTLSTVAGLYGVDMDRLRSDNRIRGDTLYVGQILTVRSNIPLQAQSRPSTRTTWVEVTPGEPLYHTVQRGDTVGAIAERYRVTQAQLRELNNLSGNSIRAGQKLRVGTGPAAPAPSSAASGRLIEYKVREGDTLSTVAESFGMKTADLRAANRLSGDVIRPGQTLRVKDPGGGTGTAPAAGPAVYEVKSGDTVSQIAERFRLTSAELRSLNNLSGDTIRAGQKLRVSSAAAAATLSPASPGVEDLRVAEGPAVYEVKSGETLSQIAERFRTSTAALRSLNGLSGDTIRTGQRLRVGSSSAAAGASQAASAGGGDSPAVVYEVKSGETVSQIAERFRMNSAELRALNGLSGDTIRVGQRLRVRGGGAAGIPSGDGGPASPGASGPGSASSGTGVYEVRSGDTVSQVAERFGMSSADLRALNNLSGDTIRAGQRLRVRGGASPSQGASPGGTPPLARQAPPSSGTGVYEVRTGDTVSQIAESFGMSSAELRALNNLSGDTIRVGQRLQVSGGGSPASRPQAPASQPQAPASPLQAPASPPQAPAAPQPSQPAAPSFAPGQIPLNAPPPPPQSQAPGPRTASGSLRDPAPGSGSGTYEVQSGDTVSQIAERHGMSSADLRALNNLSGDTIRVGQKLRVSGSIRRTGSSGPSVPSGSPGGGASAYKVQDGDTLFSIASRHGMSVDELRRLNGRIGDIVRPGETIRVK